MTKILLPKKQKKISALLTMDYAAVYNGKGGLQ